MQFIEYDKFDSHQLKPLATRTFCTESYIFKVNYNGPKIYKEFKEKIDRDIDVILNNKLYTVQQLDLYRDLFPYNCILPDSVIMEHDKIKGILIPFVNGVNLSNLTTNHNYKDYKKHIKYLKQIGQLLEDLKQMRKNTELKDFYINDLHDGNFIINPLTKKLYLIDLDGCKIGNNSPVNARFLMDWSLANIVNEKYPRIEQDFLNFNNFVPNENTDMFCYIMVILNYLINNYTYDISDFDKTEYLNYLDYLETLDINKELLDIFYNVIQPKDNQNPMHLLDSLTKKQLLKAESSQFYKW